MWNEQAAAPHPLQRLACPRRVEHTREAGIGKKQAGDNCNLSDNSLDAYGGQRDG